MTTRLTHARIAIGLAVGLLVALPACGSSGDGGSEEASSENFCDAYVQFNADVDDDPTALFDANLDRLVATAPDDDLRQAAETVREGLASLEDVDVDTLDVNDPEALSQVEAAIAQVFTEEFNAAADQIDDYASTNCPDRAGD